MLAPNQGCLVPDMSPQYCPQLTAAMRSSLVGKNAKAHVLKQIFYQSYRMRFRWEH